MYFGIRFWLLTIFLFLRFKNNNSNNNKYAFRFIWKRNKRWRTKKKRYHSVFSFHVFRQYIYSFFHFELKWILATDGGSLWSFQSLWLGDWPATPRHHPSARWRCIENYNSLSSIYIFFFTSLTFTLQTTFSLTHSYLNDSNLMGHLLRPATLLRFFFFFFIFYFFFHQLISYLPLSLYLSYQMLSHALAHFNTQIQTHIKKKEERKKHTQHSPHKNKNPFFVNDSR